MQRVERSDSEHMFSPPDYALCSLEGVLTRISYEKTPKLTSNGLRRTLSRSEPCCQADDSFLKLRKFSAAFHLDCERCLNFQHNEPSLMSDASEIYYRSTVKIE
jgi:hypothetical protein